MSYDIIGDIHGHRSVLERLFATLGYRYTDGVYRHETRQVVFVGDFIDRGPDQRGVVDIARAMIEAGTALAVMGNHELNAIGYVTKDPETGEWLREHSDKNEKQHRVFLDAYPFGSAEHLELIDWFRTLPLWLDLGEFRVVHACWDASELEFLESNVADTHLPEGFCSGERKFDAIETLLKGPEIELPAGMSFLDKDGIRRTDTRIRWWVEQPESAEDFCMVPKGALEGLRWDPHATVDWAKYGQDACPVFFGHYWFDDERPEPLTHNVACLDYSVVRQGGKLVAYRWDGRSTLAAENFVWVEND